MKLYLEEIKLGDFSNISFYTALEAYYNMGFELVYIKNMEEIEVEDGNIFLGSIQFIHRALAKLNIPIPEAIDYPICLNEFLGRKVWESSINEIANDPASWGVFVKPRGMSKKFTGRVINGVKDLVGCGDLQINVPIWVSEPVAFVSEWRVFVRYNKVLGVRHYRGDWRAQYDHNIIQNAVDAYTNSPAGYTLDFGLSKDNKLLLIEVNDGYALGNYGLFYIDYAKLLSARWAEMTGQDDLCDF